jgi:phage shock protein A
MDLRTAMLKALEQKLCKQLQRVNSGVAQIEDRAQVRAEIETTDGPKTRQQIDEEFEGLKRCAKAQVEGIAAQINADMSRLKSSVEHLAIKLSAVRLTRDSSSVTY